MTAVSDYSSSMVQSLAFLRRAFSLDEVCHESDTDIPLHYLITGFGEPLEFFPGSEYAYEVQ